MITAISPDGTEVRAFDEGRGAVVLVIHPGLDDGRSWAKVARRLEASKCPGKQGVPGRWPLLWTVKT